MTRSLAITAVLLTAAACAAVRQNAENPYEQPPFYAKYLNTGSELDAQITATLDALRAGPRSATLHNELGALLVHKNFPKDAARELERAIAIDPKFYPAWYNLGLVRAHLGDHDGAHAAMERTVELKPGHPQALFHLGLNAEKRGQKEKAVGYYAKAYTHNPRLLDVRHNPRILDSKLTHLALLQLYGRTHSRQSATFIGPPPGYGENTAAPAPATAPAQDQPVPDEPSPVPPAPTETVGAVIAPPTNPITQTST